MTIIGFILAVIGAAGLLLEFTGMIEMIPPVADMGIPMAGWGGALIVGAVLVMLNRRTSD